jgi:hypothetical protein
MCKGDSDSSSQVSQHHPLFATIATLLHPEAVGSAVAAA